MKIGENIDKKNCNKNGKNWHKRLLRTSWTLPLTMEDKNLESKLQMTLVLLTIRADDDRAFHNLHIGLSVSGRDEFAETRKPCPLSAMEVAGFTSVCNFAMIIINNIT